MMKLLRSICILTAILGSIVFAGELQVAKDITAQQARELLREKPEVIIVDVRTPKEFLAGHLKNAINIDIKNSNFESELSKLDREKVYLVHCRSGARSRNSLETWSKLGFKMVFHMKDGYLAWEKTEN